MSEKMTCPGCGSHTSTLLAAVHNDEPCPDCGLSAAAILEITDVRRRGADAELTTKYEALLKRVDQAETEAAHYRRIVEDIRAAVKPTPPIRLMHPDSGMARFD